RRAHTHLQSVPTRRSSDLMQRKYGADGLQIIGINVDKERALADEFLAETPAEFELRFDPAGKLAEAFGVQAMPSSFLLDASGNVDRKSTRLNSSHVKISYA